MLATVDLPEPDSPTMASVVPRLTEKRTSSTALNISFLRGKFEFLGQVVDGDDGCPFRASPRSPRGARAVRRRSHHAPWRR